MGLRSIAFGTIGLAFLVFPGAARADRIVPASECMGSTGSPVFNVDWVTVSSSGEVVCPFTDMSADSDGKTTVTAVYVDGNDGSSTDSVEAFVCSIAYDGSGGGCGTGSSSGASYTGSTTSISLAVSGGALSYWASGHDYDYGYVLVYLPAPGDLRGLYISG